MKTFVLSSAAALLSLTAASAQAPMPLRPAPDLATFDASQAATPADKLVLCDTTAFVRTRPNLSADRMFARRDGQPPQLLLGPYYVQGGVFYSQRYERLFGRLSHDKQVSLRQVIDAQATLGRQMVRGYGRGPWLPERWSNQQQGYCDAFARQNGVHEPE